MTDRELEYVVQLQRFIPDDVSQASLARVLPAHADVGRVDASADERVDVVVVQHIDL